jgi:hypothetical protein
LKVNIHYEVKPGELRCPVCFGRDIVPSMPRGWRDWLMAHLGRIPRHCRFCGRRFYTLAQKKGQPDGDAPLP